MRSWICSACEFDMTGLDLRDALKHFFAEHGTVSDRDLALRDFPGMSIGSGRVGDGPTEWTAPFVP